MPLIPLLAPASSGNRSPADIAGLSAWYRAGSLVLADGAFVSTWPDSGPDGHDATQATSTKQPTFRTNVINGKPAVRFDGGDGLASTAPSDFTNTTIFSVVSTTTLATDQTIRGVNGSGGVLYRFRSSRVNVGFSTIASTNQGTTPVTINTWRIDSVSYTDAGNEIRFYAAGADDGNASVTISPTAGRTTIIGEEAGQSARFFNGDIAELIVFDRVLDAADRAYVHSYLQDEYDIAVVDYIPPPEPPPPPLLGGSYPPPGTRFYLHNAAVATAMPALTMRGGWDVGSTTTFGMSPVPAGTSSGNGFSVANAGTREVLNRTFVSEPLAAGGVLGGDVIRHTVSRQTIDELNAFIGEYIYVTVGSTNVVRGVLSPLQFDDIEMFLTYSRRLARLSLTPVTVQAGDRIVIESGYRTIPDAYANSAFCYLSYGGTTANAWYEFDGLADLTPRNPTPWPLVNAGLDAVVSVGQPFARTAREH